MLGIVFIVLFAMVLWCEIGVWRQCGAIGYLRVNVTDPHYEKSNSLQVEHIENSKWNEDENPAAARDLVCINSWRGPLVTIESQIPTMMIPRTMKLAGASMLMVGLAVSRRFLDSIEWRMYWYVPEWCDWNDTEVIHIHGSRSSTWKALCSVSKVYTR